MDKTEYGAFGKAMNAIFYKVPWFIFPILLIGIPVLLAILSIALPNQLGTAIGNFLSLPIIIVLAYAVIGVFLLIMKKALKSDDLVDIAYRIFYKPSYILFFVVLVISVIAFTGLDSLVHSIDSKTVVGIISESFILDLETILLVLVFYGLGGMFIRFILRHTGWCPNCGKFFSMEKTSREVVNSEQISIKQTLNQKNRNGDVIGTTEQYIPGTRETVKTVKTCKHCGGSLTSHKTSQHANV